MNWAKVRRDNARRSARKVRRERYAAERARRVAELGGEITAAEIRGASHRIEPPAAGYFHERHVWTFRGRDWTFGYSDGDQWYALALFRSHRQDPDRSDCVPFTAGARKAFMAACARIFGPISDD